jgi:hypothetical protein
MYTRKLFVAFLFLFLASQVRAQSLTDAVRLGTEPFGTGARATAMGGAAIANANDYSALDWNPAALTLMNAAELTLSGFFKGHNSTAQYLGTIKSDDLTNFDLGSFGYAAGVPTTRGHLAFGISYDRVKDYNATYSFNAVNANSSLLNTQGFVLDKGNPSYSTTDYQNYLFDNNLAWSLYLTHNADSAHPKLTTPFGSGGLQQSGTVTEQGGVNALRIGGGIDVSENLAIGGTLNFFFGSYNYRRVYNEKDVNNIFTTPADSLPPNNFQSAQIIDTRNQTQAGFSVKLGLLASPNEHLHFGFTFETPQVYSVHDEYQRTGSSVFRDGRTYNSTDPSLFIGNYDVSNINPSAVNNYTVTTPIKLGAGASFTIAGLTISGAADFSDQSQLRYSNADIDLSDLNDSARANLRAVLNWKLGAEYVIKPIGLILRGGFAMDPSPYKGDPSNYNTTHITGGLGILLSKSAICELTYVRTTYRTNHIIYSDADITSGNIVTALVNADDIVQNQFLLSFSFRW